MSTARERLLEALVAKAREQVARATLPDDLTDAEAASLAASAFTGMLRTSLDRLRAPTAGDYVRLKDSADAEAWGYVYGFGSDPSCAAVVTTASPRSHRPYQCWDVPCRSLTKAPAGAERMAAIDRAEQARRADFAAGAARRTR